jgi:ParB/RepB/Spo0J family partition protein
MPPKSKPQSSKAQSSKAQNRTAKTKKAVRAKKPSPALKAGLTAAQRKLQRTAKKQRAAGLNEALKAGIQSRAAPAPKTRRRKGAAAPAAAAGAPAPAAELQGRLEIAPAARIHESPLNPRKHFDAAKLRELAESIAAKGLLQNLVVRPHPKIAGDFEIVTGARRRRALGLLVEDGRAKPDYPVPVRIVAASDRELVKMAAVENIQRQDMHPLEEADCIVAMRKQGMTNAEIGAELGMGERWLQKRLALADRLTPEAKAAFREGAFSVWFAEALTKEKSEKRQRQLVKEIAQGYFSSAKELTHRITRDLPPVSAALFDPAHYTGALVSADDDTSAPAVKQKTHHRGDGPWFADIAEFEVRQRAAIDQKVAELEEKWAWVEVHHGYVATYNFGKSQDRKKAGAIIEVNRDLQVEIHEGLVKPSQKASGGKAKSKSKAKAQAEAVPPEEIVPVLTSALMVYAKNRKTEAVQRAIAQDGAEGGRLAMVMTCLALMGADGDVRGAEAYVKIRQGETRKDDSVLDALVMGELDTARAGFGKLLATDDDDDVGGRVRPDPETGAVDVDWFFRLRDYFEDEDTIDEEALDAAPGRAFAILYDQPIERLTRLFAALVAARCGSFVNLNPQLGDPEVVRRLAIKTGAHHMREWCELGWGDYLALCKKSRLVRLAADMPALGISPGSAAKMKTAALAAAIKDALDQNPGARGEVPLELQFLSRRDIETAMASKGEIRTVSLPFQRYHAAAAAHQPGGDGNELPPAAVTIAGGPFDAGPNPVHARKKAKRGKAAAAAAPCDAPQPDAVEAGDEAEAPPVAAEAGALEQPAAQQAAE